MLEPVRKAKTFRIELYDAKRDDGTTRYTPPKGHLRVVYESNSYEDPPLASIPPLIDELLRQGAFESARSFANAWFVALANSHGHQHVELGPKPSSGA